MAFLIVSRVRADKVGFGQYIKRTNVASVYDAIGVKPTQLEIDVGRFFDSQLAIDVESICETVSPSSVDQLPSLWVYDATLPNTAGDNSTASKIVAIDKRPLMSIDHTLSSDLLCTHEKTMFLARIRKVLQTVTELFLHNPHEQRHIDWVGLYAKFSEGARRRAQVYDSVVESGPHAISGDAGVLLERVRGKPTSSVYALNEMRSNLGSTNVDRLVSGSAIYIPDVASHISKGGNFSLCGSSIESTEINIPILDRNLVETTGNFDAEDYQVKNFLRLHDNESDGRLKFLALLWACFSLGQTSSVGLDKQFRLES